VSVFLGTVRDSNDGRPVSGIDYSAYEAMAVAEMNRIVGEAEERFTGVTTALVHRIGTLRVGDVSVAIAVSHPHRAQALDATRYVIEELKQRVPIWKREHYLDGTSDWVDPRRRPVEVSR
jgi:molybdopterin synthase catalytic subunit